MAKTRFIVGIDEVGRGPLAGPLTVGAVLIDSKVSKTGLFDGVRDSKRLSANKRLLWYYKFIAHPDLLYAVASVSAQAIDRLGISVAARQAVKSVLDRLAKKAGIKHLTRRVFIYLDGSLYAPKAFRQKTVIKGDERIPVIAAASIIAKVSRDRMMIRHAKRWPVYGFEQHKGYGTRKHYAAIRRLGITQLHRKSFL
ncbi:MAG: hypothetical protein A3A80_00485 [Candidatus Terrybacteria bacterium RIFCSPLOWO2_01_FULL_44_24]|uniref:Ribonuclease n=1 Tax=Candidatus Terrybacteria bacterium RIFCSPHIGHO2_01_FULL_43_35 TaxID=1802361 RepID=A0A1G2PDU7_9BACT|nr:MAG: hypothetical protein A2828_01465 [Candidatus Terrybacteria bacterium RIFCSPHIGHO2_01_FULL_43_35]OHA49610.1 MAG: hypothetical protein A3B75_00150 [Candidatus Terrybacteria bacterium RIFCSPHIGHO2_02_FULL_43_14]OHA51495.1 MAG: hypothetical protein A3A80_00485 [Candidatus Terrybacteria bacterium RIFCSPLOWO2_01_FULL_44_24]